MEETLIQRIPRKGQRVEKGRGNLEDEKIEREWRRVTKRENGRAKNREEETTEKNKDRKEQMKLRRVKYFQFQQNLSFVSRIHDVC